MTDQSLRFLVFVDDGERVTVARFRDVTSAIADARWASHCGFHPIFEGTTTSAHAELLHVLKQHPPGAL
jgi:hypothetical protein